MKVVRRRPTSPVWRDEPEPCAPGRLAMHARGTSVPRGIPGEMAVSSPSRSETTHHQLGTPSHQRDPKRPSTSTQARGADAR